PTTSRRESSSSRRMRSSRAVAEVRPAYTAAGVDVAAGERAVDLMRAAVEATGRPEVLSGFGGFGSAVTIPPGYRSPVLISSSDGVGPKTAIAAAVRPLATTGGAGE